MIDKLIKNEDTDCFRELWSGYRERLTDYVISGVEHYETRKRLNAKGVRRLNEALTISDISGRNIRQKGKKPTLAIWGAGGCNDIDVRRLSDYFALVLIDRDVEKLYRVREVLKLSENECACIDLQFFDISLDEYEMFEALLMDGAQVEELTAYLNELMLNMKQRMPSDLHFDYSVMVGLASQLVSRLAALAHGYGRLGELSDCLKQLSTFAVKRLMDMAIRLTSKLLICGYEISEELLGGQDEEWLKETVDRLNADIVVAYLSGTERDILGFDCLRSSVEGNNELLKQLKDAMERGEITGILDACVMEWPFTNEKHYLMNMLAVTGEQ